MRWRGRTDRSRLKGLATFVPHHVMVPFLMPLMTSGFRSFMELIHAFTKVFHFLVKVLPLLLAFRASLPLGVHTMDFQSVALGHQFLVFGAEPFALLAELVALRASATFMR